MYLIDTNVISELRKGDRTNAGVKAFFRDADVTGAALFLSVITVGELQRGVDLIAHRGDVAQARLLSKWLDQVLELYRNHILDFSDVEARVWGRLRVPRPENAIDKQIAATALTYDLTLVTRNVTDFEGTAVRLCDPFL